MIQNENTYWLIAVVLLLLASVLAGPWGAAGVLIMAVVGYVFADQARKK